MSRWPYQSYTTILLNGDDSSVIKATLNWLLSYILYRDHDHKITPYHAPHWPVDFWGWLRWIYAFYVNGNGGGYFISIHDGCSSWESFRDDVNTLRPRQMNAISQTTFSNAFSWVKIFEFRLKFHWSLFPWVQLPIFQQWFRQWLGAVQVTSHYQNQWWLVYRRIYASIRLN